MAATSTVQVSELTVSSSDLLLMPQHLWCHAVTCVHTQGVQVKTLPTKPIDGQKTGTSGLRKKTSVFMGENYLANW